MSVFNQSATAEIVQQIRDAETLEDAITLFSNAITPPKIKNAPPTLDEVLDFARDRAFKTGGNLQYLLLKAEEAFNFYQSNMEVMEARTWKDGNGNPVKNWKLKICNNWFSQ